MQNELMLVYVYIYVHFILLTYTDACMFILSTILVSCNFIISIFAQGYTHFCLSYLKSTFYLRIFNFYMHIY